MATRTARPGSNARDLTEVSELPKGASLMSASPVLERARRGALIVACATAAAVALPQSAAAAAVDGTVVATDGARGTVVTVSRKGVVRTVRAKRVRHLRVGQRVTAKAAAQADGTFAAAKVRRSHGAAPKRVRFKATVVQAQGRRVVVSAGSSTFALPRGSRARAASAGTPVPGDVIVADVGLGSAGPTGTTVTTVGETRLLELEGLFLDVTDGVLRVAVERRGLVTIAVPAGREIAATAGDEIEAVVSLSEDGAFTLVALEGEGDHLGIDLNVEDGTAEVEGRIASMSETAIAVASGPHSALECAVPAGLSLEGFAVGDEVEMECARTADGSFELRELESDDREVEYEPAPASGMQQGRDDADEDDEESGEDDDEPGRSPAVRPDGHGRPR